MKNKLITTYEASVKYKLSTSYLRRIMQSGKVKGRIANVGKTRMIWLIDEASLKKFLDTRPAPGRPKA